MEKRRMTAGFTLVELIAVIAILGILAGVGTVGYSGYIKKANMAADEQLIGDVKSALALAYYADSNAFESGVVVLSLDQAPDAGNNEWAEGALTKAFGDGWDDLRLKYDGWTATFQGSNFYTDGTGLANLLGTVDTLTDALGGFLSKDNIAALLGSDGRFSTYVSELGAETPAEKADAAVFYVADVTSQFSAEKLQKAADALIANSRDTDDALGAMNNELGSTLASTAALYALAEGYASYFDANYSVAEGVKKPGEILDEATAKLKTDAGTFVDGAAAFKLLKDTFTEMGGVQDKDGNYQVESYLGQGQTNSPLKQDLNAYAEAMKTVSASKNNIMKNNKHEGTAVNLGDSGYFSTDFVSGLLTSYSEGAVFVYAQAVDGVMSFTSSIDTE